MISSNFNRMLGKLQVSESADQLIERLAQRFAQLAKESISSSEPFTVSLSGGSTPKALYERLTKAPYADSIDWKNVLVFLGDERCVAHGHPDSNYSMIEAALLSKVALAKSGIFPTIDQDKDPAAAAEQYDETLRRVFQAKGGEIPAFDLILLGLGPDGHTASLFPGSKALQEKDRLYVENFVAKFDSFRLTMTYPLINAGRNVAFMVSGGSKATILQEVLEQPEKHFPSQGVQPSSGNLEWFVDRAAVNWSAGAPPASER